MFTKASHVSSNLIRKAIQLCRKSHAGQYRRDGKTPYFTHPKRVARLVSESGGSDQQIILAYLHDVVENYEGDGSEIEQEISETFGMKMLKLVLILTRDKNMGYSVYLQKIKKNPAALLVKLCDMVDNLSDKPTEKQKRKYVMALSKLISH